MTQQRCIALAQGRRYAGVVFDTCYGSENLDETVFVPGNSCNVPCPGDNTQVCGGNAAATNSTRLRARRQPKQQLSKRAAPPNVLLTIFELGNRQPGSSAVAGPGPAGPGVPVPGSPTDIANPNILNPVPGNPGAPGVPGAPVAPVPPGAASNDIVLPNVIAPTGPRAGTTNAASPAETGGIAQAQSFLGRPSSTGQQNPALRSLVTTIPYATIDSARPNMLVSAELCTTLYYEDCGCPNQILPTVPMATIRMDCNRCGEHGESIVTLTVPAGVNPHNSLGGTRQATGAPGANSIPQAQPNNAANPTIVPTNNAVPAAVPTQTLVGVPNSQSTSSRPNVVSVAGAQRSRQQSGMAYLASIFAFSFVVLYIL
ncbi:uncharacterized protein CTRU02_203353 [Colletotrichum truncatum]|uniref:Uncharacterized protein n=1 Tax=Colletotrichum truncatum TaxID=5467 RepID=A0ACC3Z9C4_COLTU